MRVLAATAFVTAAATLVACRADYPAQSTRNPPPAASALQDSQAAPPATAELTPQPPSPADANGPPTVIIPPLMR